MTMPATSRRGIDCEGRAMFYELRDHPDDLPIPCETLAEAQRCARARAARFGISVLIYEMDPFTGERLVDVSG